jgi:aldose sugar dehydrogenase
LNGIFRDIIQGINTAKQAFKIIYHQYTVIMSKKSVIILFIASLFILGFVARHSSETQTGREKKAKKIYAQYCSGCHGEHIEAFVDRKWKYGTSMDSIIKSIAVGSPDFGMPSYKDALRKKEIADIAQLMKDYLKNIDLYRATQKPTSNVFAAAGITITLDTIATGMISPWGFAQLPDGNYLASDRHGTLYRIGQHQQKTVIKTNLDIMAEGQGGLLDIELHPGYAGNGWVYLSYAKFKEVGKNKLSTTALVRGKITNNEFTDVQEIFEALPYAQTRHHYGSKIIFDDKGFLYFSVGERGKEKEFPQYTKNDNGKIHRLNDDGSIPKDNPFVNDPESRGSIFSYGHRNPQGLIFNSSTGEIWETEHGPRGGDELNIIRKGYNYGWPVITYGINYDGKPISNISAKAGMEQPEIYWTPSIAPCGMTMVTGDKYPGWKGDIMVGSLRYMYVDRCVMKNNKVVKHERLLTNIGRVRNVEMGNDGYLYVAVEKPGMIFRLMPK